MVQKVHVNVGTIGHIDHGKTTLTTAILRVQSLKGLATYRTYDEVAKGGITRDKNKTVTVITSHVEYETDSRHYAHVDCPGHADYIKIRSCWIWLSWSFAELLAALDSYIPVPVRSVDKLFRMSIENVYSIEGRGTVVTGVVDQGVIRTGDSVDIVGLAAEPRRAVCTQIKTFTNVLSSAAAGANIGCLLRGVGRDEIERGQVLAATGSMTAHARFQAEVYVLGKEEGGRHTPFVNGYTPQFFFRTTDVTGEVALLEGAEMAMPGDGIKLGVALQKPIALDTGARFAVREGNRTVGSGVVTSVLG
jgi:elongation factor Tu